MDNAGTRLVVFLLGDPHLLEGGERGKDGSSNPDRVFPLWRSNDLDLHGGWSQGGDLLLHTVSDSREHSGTSGKDGVGVEILSDVNITLHDRVVASLVDTGRLHSDEGRLEEGLRTSESLVTDGNDLSVRELIALLKGRRGSSSLHLGLKVQGNVAQLLLK